MSQTMPFASRGRRLRRLRTIVQLLASLVLFGPFLLCWMLEGAKALPSWMQGLKARLHSIPGCMFHCYACPLATFACPIGVMAGFASVHVVPLLTLGVLVLAAAAVGSMVCGWICPFGFLQDLADRIPTPKLRIPNWMGFGRYVVLIGLVVAVPMMWGKEHNPLFICRLCPAGAVEASIPATIEQSVAGGDMTWLMGWPKVVILIVFVAAVLFTRRPWCTVFCPLGGLLSLLNRLSFVHLRFDRDGCVECNRCRANCRYGVHIEKRLNDTRCNRCLECTACPGLRLGLAGLRGKGDDPA